MAPLNLKSFEVIDEAQVAVNNLSDIISRLYERERERENDKVTSFTKRGKIILLMKVRISTFNKSVAKEFTLRGTFVSIKMIY